METFKNQINRFFEDYETRFNHALSGADADIDGTVHAFTSCFIEASPLGVSCAKNDSTFREAIPKGYAFYKSIGTESMTIGTKDISILDAYHAMVKVHWLSAYLKKDGSRTNIDFDVFYFVQLLNQQLKIFAYITGDEQKVLQTHGLIP